MRYLSYILIGLLLFLTSCGLCGNGDGYCGHQGKLNVPAGNNSDPSPSLVLPVIYRWYVPGFTCIDSHGTSIPSYKDKMEIRDGKYVSLGTACERKETILPADEVEAYIFGGVFGYQNRIYVHREEENFLRPEDTYPELWCTGNGTEVLVYRQFGSPTYTLDWNRGWMDTFLNRALDFVLAGTVRTYFDSDYEIKIDTATSSNPDTIRYDGSMNRRDGMGWMQQPAKCRFTPPI